MKITARPFGFDAPSIVAIQEGMSLSEIVVDVQRRAGVPLSWRSHAAVQMNGHIICRDEWDKIRPADGDNIVVSTMLHGGGDGNKNPIATILSIAVMVAAPQLGAWAAGPGASATAVSLWTASFAVAGTMLINAAFPVRQPGLASQSEQDSPTYSLSGARNNARRFGAIPVVLGTHRHTPPLGAASYTEILGNDEFLRMLVVWGYGPLKIENIRIGNTLLSDYADVEIETFEGRSGDAEPTIFPGVVSQESVGSLLTNADGYTTRTSDNNADEISVDIACQAGLVELDGRTKKKRRVEVRLEYKETSASTWTTLLTDKSVSGTTVDFPYWDEYSGASERSYSIYLNTGTLTISYTMPESYIKIADVEVYRNSITSITEYSDSRVTGLAVTDGACSSHPCVDVASGVYESEVFDVTAKSTSAVRRGYRFKVTRGTYDVRMKRVTADTSSTEVVDKVHWGSLRTFTNENPINYRYPLAISALRIRASEQLSGVLDNLNADVTSYVKTWDGVDWDTEAASNNPAALYRHVLTSNANSRARTASQIDDDTLGDWYDTCTTEGFKFNMVRDAKNSVWDTLADIASSARAAPTLSNGKWSIIVDEASKPVKQHFTPRNSWGFQSQKVIPDAPHAFRVRFVNENESYSQDERVVYDDGYSSANATKFEGLEFPGITDPDLVWRLGRYHIAQNRLRPEQYTFNADFEHLACERGDVILASHDVPLWGLGWGRVKEVLTSGADKTGVVVDEAFTMESGGSYNVRFRLENGDSVVLPVDTVGGENTTLTFTSTTTENLQAGDLCIFGEVDTETQRLIVKSIDRDNDMSAKITCVDEAPDIYDADTGTIPAFDSNITEPLNVANIAPAKPVIISIESGTAALEVVGDTIISRIIINLEDGGSVVPAARFRVRYRDIDNDAWSFEAADAESGAVIISNVDDGETYKIQAQTVSEYGVRSEWTDSVLELVFGQDELPPDVSDFSVNIVAGESHLSWTPVTAIDMSHYAIRWSPSTSGATWASSVDIVDRASGSSAVSPAQVGTYLIKAVDMAGNKSENAAASITTVAKLQGLNLVDSITDTTFDGTKDDTVYSADNGGLIIDTDTDGTLFDFGYYYNDSQIDLGSVHTSRINGQITTGGVDLSTDLYDHADLYTINNLYGAAEGSYSALVDIRTTNDDPSGTPTWSSWRKLIVGDYTARAFEWRIKLTGDGEFITPIVSQVYFEVDMPDRIYRFSETIAAGGTRVAFTPAFYDFPGSKGLGISVFDGEEGDRYTVTNLDKTGFDIAFTNSGANVERTISGVAQSYGELDT